jgi:predicted DNA-binding protein
MLGLRLSEEMDARLESQARRERRSKSEIAREAIADYLHRHGGDDDYVRQARHLAALQNETDLDWLDRNLDDALSAEPPYDWGNGR